MLDNEKTQSQQPTGQANPSKSRRNFTKAALIAPPVLMSVVSRPVFGVGCLSNVLSGNLSDPNRGTCNLGLSPGYWKEHPEAWPSQVDAGVLPNGSMPTSCNSCKDGNGPSFPWICSGGTLFNDEFLAGPQDADDRSLHQVICEDPSETTFHIIAALLNAYTDPNYVLSIAQVKLLWQDPTFGGKISSMQAFLDGTWT